MRTEYLLLEVTSGPDDLLLEVKLGTLQLKLEVLAPAPFHARGY
jgi:hypothetical protein